MGFTPDGLKKTIKMLKKEPARKISGDFGVKTKQIAGCILCGMSRYVKRIFGVSSFLSLDFSRV